MVPVLKFICVWRGARCAYPATVALPPELNRESPEPKTHKTPLGDDVAIRYANHLRTGIARVVKPLGMTCDNRDHNPRTLCRKLKHLRAIRRR